MIQNAIVYGAGGGGVSYVAQNTAPDDTTVLWVDTGNDGVLKYYSTEDSAWKSCGLAWG